MNNRRFSTLDWQRRRRFGDASTLTLLKKVAAGLGAIAVLDRNFFIGRQWSTQVGAYVVIATIDRPTALTAQAAADLLFVDLLKGDGTTWRYRVSTETRPTDLEERWVLQLTAAFNDKTAVVAP